MLDVVIDWIVGPLGAVLAAVAAAVAAYLRGRGKGKEIERARQRDETFEGIERGRDAVRNGRDSGDPADRLRRNDGKW